MTFARLRRQVESLMHKSATELTVYKLRPHVEEYCDQWEESVAQDQTPPKPSTLFNKLMQRSVLRRRFPAVYNYLEE